MTSPLQLADEAICAWDDAYPRGNPRRAFQEILPARNDHAGFVERAGPGAFLQPASPSGTSLAPRPAQSIDTVCPYCEIERVFAVPQSNTCERATRAPGLARVASCARHS
jgi:hypothetical protein